MSLNSNDVPSSGVVIDPLDAGTYPTRVMQVIDVGLQAQRPWQGEEKAPAYEVLLTYEFVDEFLKDEEGEDIADKPRALSESFVLYNLKAEKAKSTLRYNALDPTGVYEGDFSKLIEAPGMLTIVQNPGSGKNKGRIFENIAGVAPMRVKDAARLPELVNPPRVFDLDNPDLDVFNSLSEWIQKKIRGNLEFEGSALATMLADNPPAKKEEDVTTEAVQDDEEQPF